MSADLTWFIEVLGIWEEADLGGDGLTWRVREGDPQIFVVCNDLFWWATADLEEIKPEDVDLLRSCLDDLTAHDAEYFLGELFACRKRRMRPQSPWGRTYVRDLQRYEGDNLPPPVRALFDAAGPERDRKDEG